MPTNANFPTLEHGWGAQWFAAGGDSPLDGFVDVSTRTQGTVSTSRGSQYELDQVQAGTMSATLGNNDGLLDPTNTAGPYFGHINPYQPYRVRAQYPPTRNLLSPAIAECAGLSAGLVDQGSAGPDVFGLSQTVVIDATAFAGGATFETHVPAATAINTFLSFTKQPAVTAGKTYTFTVHVRNITAATSPAISACMTWTAPDKTLIFSTKSTGVPLATSTGWTTFTVTSTAPAGVASMAIGLTSAAAIPAACSIQLSGWQFEVGASATAYQTPSPWYPLYAGYVERWPQTWNAGNTFSIVQPTAVDAFALLSQRQLSDPLTAEINNHSPRFLYKLDDPSDASQVADATGNLPPAPFGISKYGAGSAALGTDITSADPGGGFAGSGTVATFNNPSPGLPIYAPGTVISLTAAGSKGPAGAFAKDFTRVVAFRYTGPSVNTLATIWSSAPRTKGSQSMFGFVIDGTNKPQVVIGGPATAFLSYNPPGSGTVNDSDWHLITCSWDASTRGISVTMDGVAAGTGTVPVANVPTDLASDALGAWFEPALGNAGSWNFKGDIAYAAEFPAVLGNGDISTLYHAWKDAFAGESTDARYNRILSYAGYVGIRDVRTGSTRSMGPANLGGQDALSALQAVVDTEGGHHYVSAYGTVCFRSRADRYNVATPVYTFGENAAGGEWPYELIEFDYDPTHLANDVQVTQESSGQVFRATDAASQLAYFPRTMTRTVNSSDPLEVQSASDYLLSRYKDPKNRISSLVLHPGAMPSLWPVALSLELGMRVRVIRRPLGRPPITVDAFVESIAWNFDDKNDATVTVQCSPVDATPYGYFAAWHSLLGAACAIGDTTVTVRAPVGNSNLLAAMIAPGQVMSLSPGAFATRDNVTVKSVATTVPGWTTATITFTTALTKSHPINDPICELLPAGVTTGLATWDTAASAFDSHAFVY